jgi:hypothetical protein
MWPGFTRTVQADHDTSEDPITVAIERRVDAHRQAEALAWVQTGTSLASRMPGYLGSGWVRANGSSSLWYTLYRFADAGSLAAWESSAERHWWLRTGEEFVHDARVERRTGIEGWFDVPADTPATSAPPRWKQAVSIWTGFFPVNLVFTLLVTAFVPFWGAVPVFPKVLVTTLILTPIMTYWVLPLATRLLRPWLLRSR